MAHADARTNWPGRWLIVDRVAAGLPAAQVAAHMVLAPRRQRRHGAVVLARRAGLNASTVGRVLARHQVPHLAVVDPITGEPSTRPGTQTSATSATALAR
jgi:hypothetical protein